MSKILLDNFGHSVLCVLWDHSLRESLEYHELRGFPDPGVFNSIQGDAGARGDILHL